MVNLTGDITMNVFITTVSTFVLSLGLAILVPLLPVGLAILSFFSAFLIWFMPTVIFNPYSLLKPIRVLK